MTETPLNVDATEVAKFDALAARWWDPDGEFRPLHEINPLRLDWIRQFADLDGARALDIGCGGGLVAEPMRRLGAAVTAIERSRSQCRHTLAYQPLETPFFLKATFSAYPDGTLSERSGFYRAGADSPSTY